jgi:hypothetical protein
LLSRISDKSKYAIFSSNELALSYQKTEKWIKLAAQETP